MTRRILLVDDEAAFLLPMQRMLHGARLLVDTAETFDQAMGLLNREQYDAVVADVRLGGVLSREGLAILEHVKKRLPGTRVLIMTGYGSGEVMRAAVSLEADRYFEKPVSFRTLSEALIQLGVIEHESAN